MLTLNEAREELRDVIMTSSDAESETTEFNNWTDCEYSGHYKQNLFLSIASQ